MGKARILIVEDEPIIRKDIEFSLIDFGYDVVAVGSFEKAIEALGKLDIDLAMLDINLGDDKDGIDIAHEINRNQKIPLVFLTSYYDTDTIERVKKTNPAAYIIKPFDEQDLKINIELALTKAKSKPQYFSEKIFVRRGQDLVALQPNEIVYVGADDNYSQVFTEREKYTISHTLKRIEEKLMDKGFIRVHKSFLVNFEKIDTISEGMVFCGPHHLPIGKSYRAKLNDLLFTL